MPQICQFLGVNSVTNIELPKGFMPALICIFADWLENFSTKEGRYSIIPQAGPQRGFEAAHGIAKWPFALLLRLVAICRFTRARRHKVGRGGRGSAQNRVEFDAATHNQA